MESYRVLIKDSAARELEKVGQKKDRGRLVEAIRSLAVDPRPPGCEKLAAAEDRFRIRRGAYRVVYGVDDRERVVTVVKIGHRREVCR